MKKPEPSPLDQQDQHTDDETFLRRWSRRKLGDAADAPGEGEGLQESSLSAEPSVDQQLLEAGDDESAHQQSRLELTDADMPSLETLDENSDYSGFFSPRVSETLRRQALRKLFHLPQFNITDGLNDYDEDYTRHEKLGNVLTHEMKRLLQRDEDKYQADRIDKQQQDAAPQQADAAEAVISNKEMNSVTNEEVFDEASIDRNTTEI